MFRVYKVSILYLGYLRVCQPAPTNMVLAGIVIRRGNLSTNDKVGEHCENIISAAVPALYIQVMTRFHISWLELVYGDWGGTKGYIYVWGTGDDQTDHVSAVECDVCAMFGLSRCVMFCRVPLCSIVYCLCLPLPLLGRPVGTYGDRGYHVH